MEGHKNPFLALIEEIDDKSQAIIALLSIAIIALLRMGDPETIVASCISGIAGMAIGKKL